MIDEKTAKVGDLVFSSNGTYIYVGYIHGVKKNSNGDLFYSTSSDGPSFNSRHYFNTIKDLLDEYKESKPAFLMFDENNFPYMKKRIINVSAVDHHEGPEMIESLRRLIVKYSHTDKNELETIKIDPKFPAEWILKNMLERKRKGFFKPKDLVEVIFKDGTTRVVEVKEILGEGEYKGISFDSMADEINFHREDAIFIEGKYSEYKPDSLWMKRIRENAARMNFEKRMKEAIDKDDEASRKSYERHKSGDHAEKGIMSQVTFGDAVNHPDYYNRYSVEVVEMARRIWGDEAMKAACEITAFIYRMRAGIKPDNPVEQDIRKETWWLDKYKEICQK